MTYSGFLGRRKERDTPFLQAWRPRFAAESVGFFAVTRRESLQDLEETDVGGFSLLERILFEPELSQSESRAAPVEDFGSSASPLSCRGDAEICRA